MYGNPPMFAHLLRAVKTSSRRPQRKYREAEERVAFHTGATRAFLCGCAIADFTPYVGAQQNWPTASGAFVSNQ
jgi:hypothetical protein